MSCVLLPTSIYSASEKLITISGDVKDSDGAPLSRRVIAYKNGVETVVNASTQSSVEDGSFTMQVNGNRNDRLRIVMVGDGENSLVFENVREPL